MKLTNCRKSHAVFDSGSVDEYQKVTAACSTLVAICSSLSPGTVYVLSTRNMKLKYSHTVDAGEINDIQFSLDEKFVVFCTNKKLIVLDAGTGKEVHVIDVPWNDKTFSKLRFVGDSTLIAGLTLAGRRGAFVAKFDVEEGELLESKKVDKIKAPTAMDARAKYIVIAGADLSIAILNVHTLKTLHIMQQVHPFAITSVSLNSREDLLASTSVANTIHVAELPADGEFHRDRATFIWAVSSLVLTILIAIAFQLLIKYQIIDSPGRPQQNLEQTRLMKNAPPHELLPSRQTGHCRKRQRSNSRRRK
jgi:prolactin regulatory element-binding protein